LKAKRYYYLCWLIIFFSPSLLFGQPDTSLSEGEFISGDDDDFYLVRSYSVIAGGNLNLSNYGSIPGNGYVAAAPDFELSFNNYNVRDIEFRAEGCDTVLLINDPSGNWRHDDDGGTGNGSLLRYTAAASGTYDIWVGTYGSSNCNATLEIETFNSVCQIYGNDSQYISRNSEQLYLEESFQVTGRGEANISDCTSLGNSGYIPSSPSLVLSFDNYQNRELEVSTNISCDAVLVIREPNSNFLYNDDGGSGTQSSIRIASPETGDYQIWVGTYSSNSNCSGSVSLETFNGPNTILETAAEREQRIELERIEAERLAEQRRIEAERLEEQRLVEEQRRLEEERQRIEEESLARAARIAQLEQRRFIQNPMQCESLVNSINESRTQAYEIWPRDQRNRIIGEVEDINTLSSGDTTVTLTGLALDTMFFDPNAICIVNSSSLSEDDFTLYEVVDLVCDSWNADDGVSRFLGCNFYSGSE